MMSPEQPRQRPSYGLPGPSPTPGADQTPGSGGDGSSGSDGHGPGSEQGGAVPSSTGAGAGTGYRSAASYPAFSAGGDPAAPGGPLGASAPPRRRRGLRMLIVGICLLILGPVLIVVGLILGVRGPMQATSAGLTEMTDATATIQAESWEMVIVLVPAADAASARCTAAGGAPGDIQSVGAEGGTQVSQDGTTYVQSVAVMASTDTSVTITCSGTSQAVYMGPINALSVLLPIGIGLLLGIPLLLVGGILTIIAIVRMVRSRS